MRRPGLLVAISLAWLGRPAGAIEPVRPPNVVVVLADDMGYGDLGCYGHPSFKTPHIDKMAAEGARLTHFNAPMPFCAPTRAALLTGRYPFRNGMNANPTPDGPAAADALALAANEITLPQLLKANGYATGMAGKWHLGHKAPESYPTRRGFDDYFGVLYSNDMRPVRLLDGEKVVEYPVVQATLTGRYTDRAVAFIEAHKGRPFFLYLAHAMPHKPLAASEGFYKAGKAGLYGDVMAELDASVGRVLAKIKDAGLDDRTLVVFTSDNGPWYGGSAGGLRGMKGTTWEGGYRVPFIARWPGRVPPGRVAAEPTFTGDIFSTALAAAGVAPPRDRTIDGADLLPILAGKGAPPHGVTFGQQGPLVATVRDARWKLHVLPARQRMLEKSGERWIDPRAPDGVTILAPHEQYQPTDYPGLRAGDEAKPMSLFDLRDDPGEQRDVAGKNPEVVARLKGEFDRLALEVPTVVRRDKP